MSNYIEKVEQKDDLSSITWDDIVDSINTQELSPRDADALSYLIAGHSIPDAANRAGMSPDTLRRHIKESKIMQDALEQKKKLILALMIHKMRKRMIKAMEISEEFLMLDVENTEMTRDQGSLYKKKIDHAEFIIRNFQKIMMSNPLEGLNIQQTGEGEMNLMLNVAGKDGLDYIAGQISKNKQDKVERQHTIRSKSNVPLLDEDGFPPYGQFGVWAFNEEGSVMCHVCGEHFKSKQAIIGHIGTHGVDKETYKEVYNIIWSEL